MAHLHVSKALIKAASLPAIVVSKALLKINVYPCLILPNAELNDKSYKERFKIKTKIIPFNVDMEECEIITSLKSMSYEDVVKGWMFAWIVMNF